MPDPFGDNEALSQDALDALVNSVDNAERAFAESSEPAAAEPEPSASEPETQSEDSAAEEEDEDDEASPSLLGSAIGAGIGSTPLRMSSFDAPSQGPIEDTMSMKGFERVQDIPLELTVELGRTRLLIKDILELRAGSIVELEKMAGEPVDILANGLLVARGEVVVIEDAFGVRITEIITSAERKALAEDNTAHRAA